jgi:hypothetical protein
MCLPVKQYWVILLLKRVMPKTMGYFKTIINDSKK